MTDHDRENARVFKILCGDPLSVMATKWIECSDYSRFSTSLKFGKRCSTLSDVSKLDGCVL